MRRRAARFRRRGGFIIIAVLIVMTVAILVTSGLLFASQAEYFGSTVSLNATQTRSLGFSGVQAVRSLLDERRQDILDGIPIELDQQYVIYETEGELGVIRLLPVTPAGDRLGPEAGKLDANMAEIDMLTATGMVDASLAQAIVDGRPYQSVADLLRIEGVTPELLYGPIEDLTVMDDAALEEGTLKERMTKLLGGSEPRGLADVLTVYGYEPNIQRSGRLRINLNTEWSDELGDRVEDRYDRNARQILQGLFDSGITFNDETVLYSILNQFNVEADEWPDIVDVFTATDSEYVRGRIDINTAPYEVLLALPGVEPEQADRIVQARDAISAEMRSTVAWPAIEEIFEPDQYETLAGWITTRTWNWRVRIAAGTVPDDDPEAPLEDPLIYEVVIDLSAPQARIAYLRDITLLQTTALLAANATYGLEEQGIIEEDDAFDLPLPDEELDAESSGAMEDTDDTREENDGRMTFTGGEDEPDDTMTEDNPDDGVNDPWGDESPAASPPAGSGSSGDSGRPRIGRWRRSD